LDCPEVNGVRTTDEVIAGYRAPATHDPSWWLALYGHTPIGVLLTTPVLDTGGWDLSYVGVVPEMRRRGLGSALIRKALAEAHRAKAAEITLSVDERNHPARHLYQRLGFRPYDRREVYLAIWQ
jgi:ribosomal protein S18 acetylase RimI-like enzyme